MESTVPGVSQVNQSDFSVRKKFVLTTDTHVLSVSTEQTPTNNSNCMCELLIFLSYCTTAKQSPSEKCVERSAEQMQIKETLRVTYIAGWGLILWSSWHNWWATGLWPHWLLLSTSQGWSCPGCWLTDLWRNSAHPDWQQSSHTSRWPGTLTHQGHKQHAITGPGHCIFISQYWVIEFQDDQVFFNQSNTWETFHFSIFLFSSLLV